MEQLEQPGPVSPIPSSVNSVNGACNVLPADHQPAPTCVAASVTCPSNDSVSVENISVLNDDQCEDSTAERETPATGSVLLGKPSICSTPRMPGSFSEKLNHIMEAVSRIESTQNRILSALENSKETAAEGTLEFHFGTSGSKSLPIKTDEEMDQLSESLQNRTKRRRLVNTMLKFKAVLSWQ